MKSANPQRVSVLPTAASSEPQSPEPVPLRPPPALSALLAVAVDEEHRQVTLRIERPGTPIDVLARLDTALEAVVVQTAVARGERLIAQQDGADWVVLGALRTSATPGIDRGDEYAIDARRIHLRADTELKLTSGLAQFALHAAGHVETIARDITTRASSVHKLIGRMLHLN